MGYLINDFTGTLIGLLCVYATYEIAYKLTTPRFVDVIPNVRIQSSMLFALVPFAVWYFYQLLLFIGPKGTSKAIKI